MKSKHTSKSKRAKRESHDLDAPLSLRELRGYLKEMEPSYRLLASCMERFEEVKDALNRKPADLELCWDKVAALEDLLRPMVQLGLFHRYHYPTAKEVASFLRRK